MIRKNCSKKHLQWVCKQDEIARKLSKERGQKNFLKNASQKTRENSRASSRGNYNSEKLVIANSKVRIQRNYSDCSLTS